MGLYRLSSTKDLIDLEITFGRDYTWISRVFGTTVVLAPQYRIPFGLISLVLSYT